MRTSAGAAAPQARRNACAQALGTPTRYTSSLQRAIPLQHHKHQGWQSLILHFLGQAAAAHFSKAVFLCEVYEGEAHFRFFLFLVRVQRSLRPPRRAPTLSFKVPRSKCKREAPTNLLLEDWNPTVRSKRAAEDVTREWPMMTKAPRSPLLQIGALV